MMSKESYRVLEAMGAEIPFSPLFGVTNVNFLSHG